MKGVTAYQLEMMQRVQKGGPDGPLDFDQMLELLSWVPSKESAQFTVRAVVKKGLMQKGELEYRRGRRRVLYSLTAEGRLVLDPRAPPAPKVDNPGVSEDLSFGDLLDLEKELESIRSIHLES